MARQNIFIKIDVNGASEAKKSVDGVSDASKKLSKEQQLLKRGYDNLNKSEKEYLAGLEQERIALQNTKFQVSQLAREKMKAGKASGNFRTQAGLNNAILLESGRLASDASFGFTAMANNLSQLVSLFGSFVATTGSVTKSFKQLGASLLGTGGVLLAVQLFIAALQSKRVAEFIESLNGLTASMKALREAFKDANDVFGKQAGKLLTLQKLVNEDMVTRRQKSMILKEIKKDHDDLNVALDEEGHLTEQSQKAIEAYIVVLDRKAKTQALVSKIQAEYVKLINVENRATGESLGFMDKVIGFAYSQLDILGATNSAIEKDNENRNKELEKSKTIIKDLQKELAKILEFDFDDPNKSGGKRVRIFKQQLLDLSKLILNFNKQEAELTVQNEREKLDLQERFAKEDISRRQLVFEQRQRQRFEDFKASTKDAEKIKDAEDKLNESLRKSREEAREATVAVEGAFYTKRILLANKEGEEIAKILRDTENAEINRLKSRTDLSTVFFDEKSKQIQDDIDLNNVSLQNQELTELERQQIIKDSFDLQEQLRQNDLQKEMALIENKKAINEEYAGWAAGIGQFFKTIAGENEELAKAGIALEKGAAIADVIINANASKAMNLATATAVGPPQNALTTIPAAIAQNRRTDITSGIAIANILATSLFGGKKSVGGGGRGGGSSIRVQAPDFNVVGASPQDRLGSIVREELAGQKEQTVKAVVSLNDLDLAGETRDNINRNNSLD